MKVRIQDCYTWKDAIKSRKERSMLQVTFNGCSDAQANWGQGEDPRGLLKEGDTYEVINKEVHSWHTLFFIEIGGKELGFNSSCFDY
jgi:hypothetical protein